MAGVVSHQRSRVHIRLVAMVLLVALAGFSGCSSPFDPYVEGYVDGTRLTDVSEVSSPYRVGGLVAVDPKVGGIDKRLQDALPRDLRAADNEAVGTIIWISWSETLVGVYKDVGSTQEKGSAYQGHCDVAVIDRAASLIVARRTFDAPAPPETTASSGDVHTEVDVRRSFATWLACPRRPPIPR